METPGIWVKYHWIHLFCPGPFFPKTVWTLEFAQDRRLLHFQLHVLSFHALCEILPAPIPKGFPIQSSDQLLSSALHISLLVLRRPSKRRRNRGKRAPEYIEVMSIRYYSDLRREQRRHRGGGFELHDIVVDRDGLLEETQQILSPLSLTTLRRRLVNLEWSSLRRESQELETCQRLWVYLNGWSLPRHINFRTLKYVLLSASCYSTALSEDLIKAFRQRRSVVRCISDKENYLSRPISEHDEET